MSDRSRNDVNAGAEEELTIEPSAEMAEALREATRVEGTSLPSTKGTLTE